MIAVRDEQHHAELAVLGFLMACDDKPSLGRDVLNICPSEAFVHQDTWAIADAVSFCVEQGVGPDIKMSLVHSERRDG